MKPFGVPQHPCGGAGINPFHGFAAPWVSPEVFSLFSQPSGEPELLPPVPPSTAGLGWNSTIPIHGIVGFPKAPQHSCLALTAGLCGEGERSFYWNYELLDLILDESLILFPGNTQIWGLLLPEI